MNCKLRPTVDCEPFKHLLTTTLWKSCHWPKHPLAFVQESGLSNNAWNRRMVICKSANQYVQNGSDRKSSVSDSEMRGFALSDDLYWCKHIAFFLASLFYLGDKESLQNSETCKYEG